MDLHDSDYQKLYCGHVPILCSCPKASDFTDRKGYFSMVLQGLVHHHGRLININVKLSGNVCDTTIFRNSGLFSPLRNEIFAPMFSMDIDGVAIPPVTLGHALYSLLCSFLLDTGMGKGPIWLYPD